MVDVPPAAPRLTARDPLIRRAGDPFAVTPELVWRNAQGQPFVLSNGDDRLLVDLRGAGVPELTHTTERTPRTRGSSFINSVQEERILEVEWVLSGKSWQHLQQLRAELVALMTPDEESPALGSLTYTPAPGGPSYRIDCTLDGGVGFSKSVSPIAELITMDMLCPDPSWYDPAETVVQLQTISGGLSVNVEVPISISTVAALEDIAYEGSAQAWPTFQIWGPFRGLLLGNNSSGRELRLPQIDVLAGQLLEIDMLARSITLDGASHLSYFDVSSRFWPLVRGGNFVEARVVVGVPRIDMRYHTRWAGL